MSSKRVLVNGVGIGVGSPPSTGTQATTFDSLLEGTDGPAVDEAFAAVGPDTIAKLLLTSGSTGHPKPTTSV